MWCLQATTEATPAAIVREYQETQQALTIQHAATRKAQREALNGEFCCVCLLVAYKVQGAQHVCAKTQTTPDFGLWRAARLARKKARKNKHRTEREDGIDVLVCANSARSAAAFSYCVSLTVLVCHFLFNRVRLHKPNQMKKILPLT
eukprot:COSAG01_NODE_11018_length_2026_cov_1.459263_3_plen_147_part_00